MFGLDQIVVGLWFLPVTLFIIMPLCVGIVWLVFSLLARIVRREATLESYSTLAEAKASA